MLTCRIPDDLLRELQSYADRNTGGDRSAVLRDAIKEFLERRPTLL